MKQILHKDSRGVAHVALIAVVLVVAAAVGFAAYRVMNDKDKDNTNNANSSGHQESEAPCESDDKDLCKFFSNWKASEQYRMTTKSDEGEAVFEVDGDKSRVKMSLNDTPYEVITIGKTTYTKAGSTWYKQTIKEAEDDVAADYEVDFDEPSDEVDGPANKATYKKLSKEACGNLTCFKYAITDASGHIDQYIWFDDQDYLLRRYKTEGKTGGTDATFEYNNVTVNEPSPVKELGPNQYIVPGQSEPMTMPNM